MMRHFWACVLFSITLLPSSIAQKPNKFSATDIHHELQKLNFLGTVLYVAAHPDDENTRLISYLSNHQKAQTIYLSLTRGDGGQNLIGPELRELLGVLRTQELLAARRVDGGEQLFSRANDFGFSKHPKETLKIWDKKKVLSDVVRAIRKLKPDVIINRFDHRSPGRTHGHHTASAMLGLEAFDLAADPKFFSDQLTTLDVWQPERIFFNTSWWFYGSRENFQKADKSNLLKVDVGVYYPQLGISNNEIASLASSQHLCQGFGRLAIRGSQDEYIELLKGSMPTDKSNIFDGINTTWSRVKGGKEIGSILNGIEANFNFSNPAAHVPKLIEAHQLLQKLDDQHWKKIKSKQLEKIILACSGLYIEASAETASSYPGGTVKINVETLNRAGDAVKLQSISIDATDTFKQIDASLDKNQKQNLTLDLTIPSDFAYTTPYWLQQPGTLGMYKVSDDNLIGKPETPVAFTADFKLSFEGVEMNFKKPILYRYSKPDRGEIYEPFVVLPEVTASFDDDVLIFSDGSQKQVTVDIKAGKDNVSGTVQLNHPDGWIVENNNLDFSIEKKGGIISKTFTVLPPSTEAEGYIKPFLVVDGKEYQKSLVEINYHHIPKQSILLPAKAKVVRLDIQKSGEHIGYIVGAGDKVPESLEQIGYQVHTINVEEIQEDSLEKYDGIVVGIRAYNVVEALKYKQSYLLDYVKNGGNLIVQYNTAGRWNAQFENIAPYELTLSRDRVTDENAPVEILAKDHALVNFPNTISSSDFDGWVQERGLYFPKEWGSEFTPILSMHDEGETPKNGSLLVARHGKGNYIYTGLSFFRELPAGVSGAYKLFANMLSLGKEDIKEDNEIKG